MTYSPCLWIAEDDQRNSLRADSLPAHVISERSHLKKMQRQFFFIAPKTKSFDIQFYFPYLEVMSLTDCECELSCLVAASSGSTQGLPNPLRG